MKTGFDTLAVGDTFDVAVIGAGVVGTNALQMAVGLGARVTVLDKSVDRLRQLDLVFGNRISTVYSTASSIEEAVLLSDRVVVMSSRPGRVVAEIAGVPSSERDSDFRMSPAYADLCRHVSRALTDERPR